ncbi:hypothetical protein LTR84_003277 [Exophiala bonariae]|uniref:Uncharacterized protein n=1 Tax=Exophiala bonariae TaxID=1690606 RepID=A0AAV9N8G5_9EURO|nr:hypothetical protein LTR84_003277 [Exophiala bonariae]
MTEPASSEDITVTFHIKSSGGQKWTLSLPLATTTQDLKTKLATEEYANVPATAQRLIYSGKVLKDNDTLATHNVKDGNTMHLVKSAASNQRQNPASQSSSTSNPSTTTPQASGVPQNLAAGTGNDPLAGLTGARYAGFAQLPSASMFNTPQTPEDIVRQLEDPNFQQMMRETMNNPQFIDMMINANPQLRQMGPQARQVLQSDYFRRLMTDPQALRSMMQMQQQMGGGGFGGMGGQEAFPAPGVTNTTEAREGQNPGSLDGQTQQQPNQQNPFAAMGNLGANPFASLFGAPFPTTQQNPSSPGTQTNPPNTDQTAQQQQQQQNPFAALFNPGMFGQAPQQGQNPPSNQDLQSQLQALQALSQLARDGGGLGGGPGAGSENDPNNFNNLFNIFGGGQPAAPPDNRPPEERYETQLRQLNDMGFYDFDRNVQALRRTGGSVQGAIEYLLSNI